MPRPSQSTASKALLITRIHGQDGLPLAKFSLDKSNVVHGINRRVSTFDARRVDHTYHRPDIENATFKPQCSDLTYTSLKNNG